MKRIAFRTHKSCGHFVLCVTQEELRFGARYERLTSEINPPGVLHMYMSNEVLRDSVTSRVLL